MKMGSINLLLSNDKLRRFKVLTINYQQQDDSGAPEVTLGEFSKSPEVEQPQQETRKKKMAVRYDQMLPARTKVEVSVASQDLKPGMAALVEPVESLQWKKGLMTPRQVVPGDMVDKVWVTNFSEKNIWIGRDTVVGLVGEIAPETIQDEPSSNNENAPEGSNKRLP